MRERGEVGIYGRRSEYSGGGGGEKDLGSCREDLTGGLEGTLFRT